MAQEANKKEGGIQAKESVGVTKKHEALFKQPDAQQAAVRIESSTTSIKELESTARQLLKAQDLAQKEATDIANETDEQLKQERMRTAQKKVDEAKRNGAALVPRGCRPGCAWPVAAK